ncbi:MAG TPA: hypothetical protein VJU83_09440 [Burkholderiales bacterium]|nr:hypothetical protein [Burkholderiales bacterium]
MANQSNTNKDDERLLGRLTDELRRNVQEAHEAVNEGLKALNDTLSELRSAPGGTHSAEKIMTDDRLNLDQRALGDAPTRGQMITPGTPLSDRPQAIGTEVMLRGGAVYIAVRIETILGTRYTGEVTGFEGCEEMTYKDVSIGDRIGFEERNIFVYSL